MEHQKGLDLLAAFPWHQYPKILDNQQGALELIQELMSILLELPTGSGKTAVGYTLLKALLNAGQGPLFYITPNKTLVDQAKELHPDVVTVYGRNEYQCLRYVDTYVNAEESPCSFLVCPNRVNQETGETNDRKAEPCPYLDAKFQAKQGGIIVCTSAFYLFTQLFSEEWPTPAGLVIDEVHRIARGFRSVLSYEITDYHLGRAIRFLQELGIAEAVVLQDFLDKMTGIIRATAKRGSILLDPYDIRDLLIELDKIDSRTFERSVREAVTRTGFDTAEEERSMLKRLENLVRGLGHYYRSLEYALPAKGRMPLNYTYGHWQEEPSGRQRVRYRLYIKGYHVAPIIRRILSPRTVAFSATIGNPRIFSFETGIEAPFHSLPSVFPVENTRVFMPTDTPNLAFEKKGKREPTRSLRRIAKACRQFADKGIRSLVVVISNKELQKFLRLAKEEGVQVISYGNGIHPRTAAARFKAGEGDVLAGTVANYGEGIDLPDRIAQVVFFLRPSRPNRDDPEAVFERERFRGNQCWAIWNWRAMTEALQVRGRIIRSLTDKGVAFFISQQFRKILLPSLPGALKRAYVRDKSFDECVEDTLELLAA